MRDLADRLHHLSNAEPALSIGFVGSIGRSCFSDLLLRAAPALDTAYRSASRKALIAEVSAGRLDVAIYPGPLAPGPDTALLCEDRLVAVLRSSHHLARAAAVDVKALGRRTVLLPADGEEGDLRRLARDLLPGLGPLVERPVPALLAELRDTDAVALIPAGQAHELGAAVCTRPLAEAAATFPIGITWAAAVRATPFRALIDAVEA